jgi:hypothetical protein
MKRVRRTNAQIQEDKRTALEDLHAYCPDEWTPAHVGDRLKNSFIVYGELPKIRGPRGLGNNWVPTVVGDGDSSEAAPDFLQDFDEIIIRRSQPDQDDIRKAELAQQWLPRLRQHNAKWAEALTTWARSQARGERDLSETCRRTGMNYRTFCRYVEHGREWLCADLIRRDEQLE